MVGAPTDTRLLLRRFDIGSDQNARAIFPPDSLSNTMFPPSYAVGARIHTNSWGGNSPAYSTDSREVDRYCFDNQDYLVTVAAGNSGIGGQDTVASVFNL